MKYTFWILDDKTNVPRLNEKTESKQLALAKFNALLDEGYQFAIRAEKS